MSTKWVVEETPEGYRIVNEENPREALREPAHDFRVHYFSTEQKALEVCSVLNKAMA